MGYGSISPLGYAGDIDSSLRFDSREIAGMLMDMIRREKEEGDGLLSLISDK